MDKKTADFYSAQADDTAKLYSSAEKGVGKYFSKAFPAGTSVLDIGCGSGRDLHTLLKMGYDAYGIDPSLEMIRAGVNLFPELKTRIAPGIIPSDKLFFNRKFDCILCSAVLMHIVDDYMDDAAFTIKNNLKPGGRLLVSVPLKRDNLNAEGRSPDGRLFIIRSRDYYKILFEKQGFSLIEQSVDQDSLGRKGVIWVTDLYQLAG